MKVYVASDHAGFNLKNALINFVRGELGYEVEDCGAFELDTRDDYPDLMAIACANLSRDLREGEDSRAILLGASGQGEAMAANRFRGIRAAVYYGRSGEQTDAAGHQLDMLASTREHNNANALCIGARFVTELEAKGAVRQWFATPFSNDSRHVQRIEKLDKLPGTL